MKTLNKLFSLAAIALCCSTAAYAEQNVAAKLSAPAPGSCEELVITAQRQTAVPVMTPSAVDRTALSASIKEETGKAFVQAMQQLMTEFPPQAVKAAPQSTTSEALQASL